VALCEHHGIATAYNDAFGHRREASTQSLRALLAEFGVRIDSAADAHRALEAVHRARWARHCRRWRWCRRVPGAGMCRCACRWPRARCAGN
jgi:hypothetical protein